MADLVQLSVKQLRKRADELHVSRERIEAARDGDDPRHDLITLIQEAAEPAVNRHRNPSYTFDDLELGITAGQPRVVQAEPEATPQPQRGGNNKLLLCIATLALLLSAAALALTVGLAVVPDHLPLETVAGREIDANQGDIAGNAAAIEAERIRATETSQEVKAALEAEIALQEAARIEESTALQQTIDRLEAELAAAK